MGKAKKPETEVVATHPRRRRLLIPAISLIGIVFAVITILSLFMPAYASFPEAGLVGQQPSSLESKSKEKQDVPAVTTNEPTVKNPSARIIYLTFDDGPGPYTATLLDTLKKYGVQATFFVTGAGSDDMIRREYNEGHAIGLHTFSHNYPYVYSSMDNFFADLLKIQDRVKNITGYTSYLMRFPGGSSNTVSRAYDGGTKIMTKLTAEVTKRGFTYFDWNVSSGDAEGTPTANSVFTAVTTTLKPTASVVLQHDVNAASVSAVGRIIEFGQKNGYTFKKLDSGAYTAHHAVAN